MKYIDQIIDYKPSCEQERVDKELMLDFICKNEDALYRTNLAAHLTVSSFVVNEAMDYVLFAFHNIYKSWSWLGGHCDGSPDFLDIALKEAKEESGISRVKPFNEDIFMLDVIHVENHIKNGVYIPDHLHLNLTFLLIGNQNDTLKHQPNENQAVSWFSIKSVLSHVNEDRMIPVYQKAFQKIQFLRGLDNLLK